MAWRIRRFFRTGKRSAKFNPALRSRGRRGRRAAEQADTARARSRASPVWLRRASARSASAGAGRRDRARARARPARSASRRASCRPRLAPCPASGWMTCAASPASATRGATRRAAASRCSGKPRGGVTSESSPSACRAARGDLARQRLAIEREQARGVRRRAPTTPSTRDRPAAAAARAPRRRCARPGTIARRRCGAAARRRNSPPPRSGRSRCASLAMPAARARASARRRRRSTRRAARLRPSSQHDARLAVADLQIADRRPGMHATAAPGSRGRARARPAARRSSTIQASSLHAAAVGVELDQRLAVVAVDAHRVHRREPVRGNRVPRAQAREERGVARTDGIDARIERLREALRRAARRGPRLLRDERDALAARARARPPRPPWRRPRWPRRMVAVRGSPGRSQLFDFKPLLGENSRLFTGAN